MTKRARQKKIALWVEGARLRTLPLAVAPVAVGTGAAASIQMFQPLLAALALAVALFLQIGVNYANDYSDGIRGTDDHRVGPMRLTGSKAVPASDVLVIRPPRTMVWPSSASTVVLMERLLVMRSAEFTPCTEGSTAFTRATRSSI